MILKLVIFFLGIIVGISGMLIAVVLALEHEVMRRKKPPTKDDWRVM